MYYIYINYDSKKAKAILHSSYLEISDLMFFLVTY